MDTEAAAQRASLPGIAMIVVGALNALFWLAWAGYALFAVVLGGGLRALAYIPAMLEESDMAAMFTQFMAMIWTPAIQTCTGCTDLFLLVGALITVLGGLRLRGLRSKGVVRIGLVALVLGPILSIALGGLAAIVSFSCCGLIFGQLPTIVLLVVNFGVAIWAAVTLSNEEVAAAFDANGG